MALTNEQQGFINVSIDHLLDFSTDLNELKIQIEEFMSALEKEVAPTNNYYDLRKLLFDPQKMLLGLEKYNPVPTTLLPNPKLATVGEIKKYIIDRALQTLKSQTPAANKLLNEQQSRLKKAIAQFKLDDPTLFRTQLPKVTTLNLPWENIGAVNHNYVGALHFNAERTQVRLVISLQLGTTSRTLADRVIRDHIELDEFENEYLHDLIPEAAIITADVAAKGVIDFFYHEGRINEAEKNALETNTKLYPLLTHNFYFSQLLCGNIGFNNILDIANEFPQNTEHKSTILTSAAVINLLKEQVCDFGTALRLSAIESQVCHCYFDLLKKKKISFDQIYNIDPVQAKLICLPLIHTLVSKEILSFSAARKIPNFFSLLCQNSFYTDYFTKHPLQASKLFELNERQVAFLLRPETMGMIANGGFEPHEIVKFAFLQLTTLSQQKISRLLGQGIISFDYFTKKMSLEQINLILTHPYLYEWLLKKVITLNDVQVDAIDSLYIKVYSNRLFAAWKDTPFKLFYAHEIENMQLITNELRFAAHHLGMAEKDFREKVIKAFLYKIKIELEHLKKHSPHDEKIIYESFIKILKTKYSKDVDLLLEELKTKTLQNEAEIDEKKFANSWFKRRPNFFDGPNTNVQACLKRMHHIVELQSLMQARSNPLAITTANRR